MKPSDYFKKLEFLVMDFAATVGKEREFGKQEYEKELMRLRVQGIELLRKGGCLEP